MTADRSRLLRSLARRRAWRPEQWYRSLGSRLLQSLARLAHERDGLGEHDRDHLADLLSLSLGVALQVHAVDGRDRHVDRKLDRVVGPRQRLLALHLFGKLRDAPLKLIRVAEQVAKASTLHIVILASAARQAPREPRNSYTAVPMAVAPEIKQRVAFETDRRARLSVPAAAGGVLFLLSAIILNAALKELPTVGLVQGLEPALRGEATPAVSPRASEVKYIDHHAFGLIAGNVLMAIAILALTLVLLFLQDSHPLSPPADLALRAHARADRRYRLRAVEPNPRGRSSRSRRTSSPAATTSRAKLSNMHCSTSGSVGIALTLLGLLAALALTVGMIAVMVGSLRAGLLPRWLSLFGILAALLFLPLFGSSFVTALIPTFWLAATGFLLWERLPSGDPPAWAAGEAIPWPTQSRRGANDEETKDEPPTGLGQKLRGALGGGEPAAELAPPPTPVAGSSRRKRRKRN